MNWTKEEQRAISIALGALGDYGTDRVITSVRGTTVPYSYARDQFGIIVELVFIRDDGWTLGCHRIHQSVAYKLWQENWIAMIIKPETEPRRIEDIIAMGDTAVAKIMPKMAPFPKRLKKPKPGGIEGVWSHVGKEGSSEEITEEG